MGEGKKMLDEGLPGTDDQFILAGVKGQLWIIHRALCFESEDPRLHLCQQQQNICELITMFMIVDESITWV